jgi:hypothetical protein
VSVSSAKSTSVIQHSPKRASLDVQLYLAFLTRWSIDRERELSAFRTHLLCNSSLATLLGIVVFLAKLDGTPRVASILQVGIAVVVSLLGILLSRTWRAGARDDRRWTEKANELLAAWEKRIFLSKHLWDGNPSGAPTLDMGLHIMICKEYSTHKTSDSKTVNVNLATLFLVFWGFVFAASSIAVIYYVLA